MTADAAGFSLVMLPDDRPGPTKKTSPESPFPDWTQSRSGSECRR
jgi:hypothetical protein